MVVNHDVPETFGPHVVGDVPGDGRVLLHQAGIHHVLLVDDLREVLPLVIVRVGVVEELFQRDGEDEDVGLAIPVRGVDVDLAVLAGDASDVNVAFGRVAPGWR